MISAHEIEKALVEYLTNESDASGYGLHRFRAQSGAGSAFQVRMGHDSSGELPEGGFILCACLDETIAQPYPGVNCYTATPTVGLVYPGDNHATDSDVLTSFDDCIAELEHVLNETDLFMNLRQTTARASILGFHSGPSSKSIINGRLREAEWSLPVFVAAKQRF